MKIFNSKIGVLCIIVGLTAGIIALSIITNNSVSDPIVKGLGVILGSGAALILYEGKKDD